MNREVLFRGKRKDNGKWVYGDLIHRQIWASALTIIRESDDGFDNYEEYEVIPETVGEYTGLQDSKGNKIFESDILQQEFNVFKKKFNGEISVVKYKQGWYYSETLPKNGAVTVFNSITAFDNMKIIGNVYDNPELLKKD